MIPNSNKVKAVCIIYHAPEKDIKVRARSSLKIEYLTSITYSESIEMENYRIQSEINRAKAINVSWIYFS